MITIVGLGGTGSILAPQLCKYCIAENSFSGMTFIDGDSFTKENLLRQDFMPAFIGYNKAEYTREKMCRMFPDLASKFISISKYIGKEEIKDIVLGSNAIFLCVDNYYIRRIIDEQASSIAQEIGVNCHIISAGNSMIDGQVQSVFYRDGKNLTRDTLCSRHSEIASASDKEDRSKMDCITLGSLPGGGQMVSANMMAATLMLCHYIKFKTSGLPDFMETFFNCPKVETSNVKVPK